MKGPQIMTSLITRQLSSRDGQWQNKFEAHSSAIRFGPIREFMESSKKFLLSTFLQALTILTCISDWARFAWVCLSGVEEVSLPVE